MNEPGSPDIGSGTGADTRATARAVDCDILERHDLAPHLFTLRTERPPGLTFVPGQFVRLGVPGADGNRIWRAYSIASAPHEKTLAFYSIVVPDGPFSQPFAQRAVGDTIAIDPTVYGFLRADRFTGGEQLWLLATGTGIAPFRSVLADDGVWSRFADLIVVHSVRSARELAYRAEIESWASKRGARLRYVPALTAGRPDERITALLSTGALETRAGLTLDPAVSRLMIAGNPSMIRETRTLLGARGFGPVRREMPGQYIVENFW